MDTNRDSARKPTNPFRVLLARVILVFSSVVMAFIPAVDTGTEVAALTLDLGETAQDTVHYLKAPQASDNMSAEQQLDALQPDPSLLPGSGVTVEDAAEYQADEEEKKKKENLRNPRA